MAESPPASRRPPIGASDTQFPTTGISEAQRLAQLQNVGVHFKRDQGISVPDHMRKAADWLYQNHERNEAERRAGLSDLVAGLDLAGGSMLVMTFNAGFARLFLNWARSCERFGIDVRDKALLFPTDAEAAKLVEQAGYRGYFDADSAILRGMGISAQYGDPEFVKHMFYQNAVIRDVLSLGYDILFQDVDVVWRRNPLDYFRNEERPRFDIELMYDGSNFRFEPLCANSGFIHLWNTACTRHLWDLVYRGYDKVLYYRSQQQPLNIILARLCHRGLRLNILPEGLFANGHLFHVDRGHVPEEAYVVHCSWTRNLEHKIEKYKIHDLWFLEL